MSNSKAGLNDLMTKIKSKDNIVLSCIATSILFLLFALIQLIMIAAGHLHVESDHIMLIVTDFAAATVAGVAAFQQNKQTAKPKRRTAAKKQ